MEPSSLDDIRCFDIHGKGVPMPDPNEIDTLLDLLKGFANKEAYDKAETIERDRRPIDPTANHSDYVHMKSVSMIDRLHMIPSLKKCFPNLLFRITGHFIYGPGDFIDTHTNRYDPSDVLYINYTTGTSGFDYCFGGIDNFTVTEDLKDGITMRAFSITDKHPFTFHKAYCKEGYRVSIGLRYVVK